MRRALLAALCLSAVAAATLAAQGPSPRAFEPLSCDDVRENRRRSTHCEILEETVTASTIDVDAGPNGGIRVQGSNRNDTRVRMMVVASAGSEQRAREIASAVRLTTTGGRIRADGPDVSSRGNRDGRDEGWYVSFEVLTPQNGDLRLNTRNGGIALHDFRGRADFRAQNGGVSLVDVNGDVRGSTTNGGLNVSLSGSRWEGAGLDVETTNGGVRLLVPASYSAILETGTVNGGLDIDFPVTVQGRLPGGRNRRLTTTLGDGGARIRVETTNGGVRVARR
jgi:hypothetical protein